MSEELTEQELAEIEERVNAATPGPWEICANPFDGSDDYNESWCPVELPHPYIEAHVTMHDRHLDRYKKEGVAIAQFIAHARTDVPALIAEVRRLREKYESYDRQAGDPANLIGIVGGDTLLVQEDTNAD